MLPFNEEFQTGESKITQVRLSVLLNNGTLLSLTEEHVMLGGLTRDSSTTVDGAFTVGAAVTGKLTVVLDNSDQSLSEYDFRAAVITASLGGQLKSGSYELIQIGIYTVDEYTYDGSTITLTAYDNFHKFDLPCSESSVTFPRTITQLITQACSLAGVTLANASIPNGSYSVTKQPGSWDTMTWHDVIAYCAQIACCYAKILSNGKLFFAWYETNSLPGDQYDGGTFDTTATPYSDGASLDGGDFDYAETVSVDGGTFGDREDVTIIGSTFDLTVDTDDVLITGVAVVLTVANNINATDGTQDYEKTLGASGYVIRVENNPLIETTSNADAVCAYLYDYLVGMRFRPLNASIPENPALESGDVALVVDRYNNTYSCFLSRVTYTTNFSTQISCDAESTMQNLKARYSESEKTRALAQRTFDKAVSNAESAMQMIMSAVATTMGLNRFTESDGHGGTIYTYGNGTTLATSNIRWRFSAGALMVSSDYGSTWNGALTANGTAVLQEIYAVKVNADNILAGTITGRTINGCTLISRNSWNNGGITIEDGMIKVDVDGADNATISTGTFYEGSTLHSILNFWAYRYLIYVNSSLAIDFDKASFSLNRKLVVANECLINRDTIIVGNLTVYGVKPRAFKTKSDGDHLMYCYETPTPYFGDIGTAKLDENGECVIGIEGLLNEAVNTSVEYCVFLQKEGPGDIWVDEKDPAYFVVKGTPNLSFSWELKAPQSGFETLRLDDVNTIIGSDVNDEDVGLSMEYDLNALDNEPLF